VQGDLLAEIGDAGNLQTQVAAFLGEGAGQPPGGLALAGKVTLDATLGGTLEQPRARVEAAAPDLRAGAFEHIALDLAGEIDRTRIVLERGQARLGGERLSATGTAGLARGDGIALEARIEQGSVASLLSAFRLDLPAEGTFRAEGRIGGTRENLTGNVEVAAEGLRLYGEPLGSLSAAASLAGSRVETTRCTLEKTPGEPGGGALEARASYDWQTGAYSLAAAGKALRIERLTLPGGVPVRGVLSLDASGSGSVEHPRLDARLTAGAPEVGGKSLGGLVEVKASVKDDRALVEARAPGLRLESSARVGLRAPYPAEVELVANDLDLSALGIVVDNAPLTGALGGRVKASGDLSAWRKGEATARIDSVRLGVAGREVRSREAFELGYREGMLRVSPAAIMSGPAALEIGGTVALERTAGRGALRVQGAFDLSDPLSFIEKPQGLFASGKTAVDLQLEGTPERMIASGSVRVHGGFLHHPEIAAPLTDLELALALKEDALVLERASASLVSGKLELAGRLPLGLLPLELPPVFPRTRAPARFELKLQDVPLGELGYRPGGVSGTLDLRASGEAPALEAAALRADVTLDRLRLAIKDYAVETAEPSTIRVGGGVARTERFRLTGPKTELRASGSLALTGDRALDVRLDGRTDASILAFLSDQARAAGETRLALTLGGTLAAPELTGSVTVAGGELRLREPRIEAEGLEARVSLTPSRAAIETLRGTLNGGSFNARGGFSYSGPEIRDVRIAAAAENVFVEFPEGFKSLANAGIDIHSSGNAIVLGGAVHIQEGSYRKPLDLRGELMNRLRAAQVVDLGEERNPLLERIRYKVSIDSQAPLTVDNNVAKLSATPSFKLAGPTIGRCWWGESSWRKEGRSISTNGNTSSSAAV